jgi:hypothetical protein
VVSGGSPRPEFPDDLLIRARKRAAETHTSLRVIIARGLRRELAGRGTADRPSGRKPGIRWVTVPGSGPGMEKIPAMIARDTNLLVFAHRAGCAEHAAAPRRRYSLPGSSGPPSGSVFKVRASSICRSVFSAERPA